MVQRTLLALRPILGLAFFLVIATSCKQSFEGLGIKVELEHQMLKNGLSLIMIQDKSVPIVAYQTWVKVGSVDETPGKTGLAHLFEHLMFKGTEKYGPKEFFNRLEAKGAEVNAYTTRDYTVYYQSFTPELLPEVIELESDRLAHLKVSEELLKTEAMVVLEERKLRTENSPEGKIQEALWGLAFSVHPYGNPVIGYPEDLIKMSVEDLRGFFKKYYQPGNITIVITGQFNPKETAKLIEKKYGSIAGIAPSERKIKPEPEQKEERRLILRDKIASEMFAQAYHISRAEDDDSYAMDVLSNILFEGNHSRAYRKLIEELDWMSNIHGASFTPTYPGLLMISGVMKPGRKSADAEKVLIALIKELQTHEPEPLEIQKAVKQLTLQLVDSVRTPHGLAQFIGTIATIFGDPSKFAEDVTKYYKVTGKDVKRVAEKYLIPNNRTVITMVPEGKQPN